MAVCDSSLKFHPSLYHSPTLCPSYHYPPTLMDLTKGSLLTHLRYHLAHRKGGRCQAQQRLHPRCLRGLPCRLPDDPLLTGQELPCHHLPSREMTVFFSFVWFVFFSFGVFVFEGGGTLSVVVSGSERREVVTGFFTEPLLLLPPA